MDRVTDWRAKRGTLPKLSLFLSQFKGGPIGEKTNFRKKVSQCRKIERGDPLGFSNIHSNAKQQKNWRGDPLVSPGMVCYAEKQEKLFWFSSLGQMVQFGAIIFCRTFKNYFDQFVWIEKKSHHYSRVSLHEAPTKNKCHYNSRVSLHEAPTSWSAINDKLEEVALCIMTPYFAAKLWVWKYFLKSKWYCSLVSAKLLY